ESIDQPIAEEAPDEHAVGQELHTGLAADFRHAPGGSTIEQRERHLVRDDGNAVLDEQAEMIGIEVGHAEVADAPFAAQPIELHHGVEIPGMSVLPPVKLQQVDARKTQALEALLDTLANDLRRHRPGKRAPLGARGRVTAAAARQIPAYEDLGAAIMIRHVEGVEPRVGVLAEREGP